MTEYHEFLAIKSAQEQLCISLLNPFQKKKPHKTNFVACS